MNDIRYQNAFDKIDEGLIIADQAEIIQFANSAACLLLGYTKDELIQLPLDIFYRPVFDTSVEALIHHTGRQANQSRELPFLFKILQVKDGRTIPIEEKISALFNSENIPDGKFIQIKDLTEIREAEIKSFSSK